MVVAGLLMHAVNLGGSHYAQYLGMSAGIAALILAVQPLVTAIVAAPLLGERLRSPQWLGVALGLLGVALVVWHKIDLRALSAPALAAVSIALTAITAGTLYQRIFCPAVDLGAAGVIQFGASFLVLLPACRGRRRLSRVVDLAAGREHPLPGGHGVHSCRERAAHADAARSGHARHQPALPDTDHRRRARVDHVRRAADAAHDAWHRRDLRRRGAGRLAAISAGHARAETGMTLSLARIIGFVVLTHTAFGAARVTSSLYALSNKASTFTVGVLMALFALVPALLAVRAGRWLDQVGPFRPLALGTGLMTAGALLPAVFPYATADVAPLLVASALLGTGFMYVQMTVQNLVGNLADPTRRPAAFSMLALGFSTSGLIAPVASGFLIDSVGHRVTFAIVFVLLAASFTLLLSQRRRMPAHRPHAPEGEARDTFELLRHPEVRAVLIVSGMISMAWDLQSFLIPGLRHQYRAVGLADWPGTGQLRRGDLHHPPGDAGTGSPLP